MAKGNAGVLRIFLQFDLEFLINIVGPKPCEDGRIEASFELAGAGGNPSSTIKTELLFLLVINDDGFMNIAIKKIELIEWLSKIQDEKLIKKVEGLRKEAEADWWDGLTVEQREDIGAGVADLETGRKKDFRKLLLKYR